MKKISLRLAFLFACGAFAQPTLVFCAEERRPFPQHTVYTQNSIKPSCKTQGDLDSAVLTFYRAWKKKYLKPAAAGQLYVDANVEGSFTYAPTRSVSEGHGYGMLATVLMAGADPGAHADFDSLYRFFRAHPTEKNRYLMAWRQITKPHTNALVEGPEDKDSATDGDMDIAYALLLADTQWGSKGGIDYRSEALHVINAVLSAESDPARHTLTFGDWEDNESQFWGGLRSSDFIPGHLKAFATASGNAQWTAVADTTYTILKNIQGSYSPKTGLLPDFIVLKHGNYSPAQGKLLEGATDGFYSYNACRDPWRIATDYLITGDPRSAALLKPLNEWIVTESKGNPDRIHDGYRLDGHALSDTKSLSFVAPFAVAAMIDPARQAWLDSLWTNLLQRSLADEDYYGNSVKLMTMIVISGNWW